MGLRAVWIAPLFVFASSPAIPCSVSRVRTAQELVTGASRIVRVRAVDYSQPPIKGDKGHYPEWGEIRFHVLEALKGDPGPSEMVFAGHLTGVDDFNDRPVPYDLVRPGGRHGNCFANEYRAGAEYLLFVREVGGKLRVAWAPLAATNEQIRGDRDPWVAWVRNEVASQRDASR